MDIDGWEAKRRVDMGEEEGEKSMTREERKEKKKKSMNVIRGTV